MSDLDAQAEKSGSKEAYHLVWGQKDYRLGVVVSVSPDGGLVHSIELLICIFKCRTELEVPLMERAIGLARELKERGYLVLFEEDGWVSCGRTLPRSEVVSECGVLMTIITRFKMELQVIDDTEKVR